MQSTQLKLAEQRRPPAQSLSRAQVTQVMNEEQRPETQSLSWVHSTQKRMPASLRTQPFEKQSLLERQPITQ